MARKQSKIQIFVQDCTTATPEELDLMLDILKGVRGKRQPAKVRGPNKPKAVKPAEAQAG